MADQVRHFDISISSTTILVPALTHEDYHKDDDVNYDELFGSDSESTGAPETAASSRETDKVTLECPRYPKIQSDGKIYFSRLATIFGVQPTPFDPSTYTGEDQEPSVKIDEYGTAKARPAPTHVIRWRYARNNKGEQIRQSNTKLVRWSDDTLCLYVGEERFTVTTSNFKVPHQLVTAGTNVLQPQREVNSRMMFQPTSKSIVQMAAQKAGDSVNNAPVMITAKLQADLLARMEAQEESARLTQSASRKRRGGSNAVDTLDADFLEEGTDIAATKAQYRHRVALAREGASSKRLMEIKEGRKKRRKLREEADEDSDDSFIASEGEVSEESISDEEE